ncbi:MAG: acyl-CoA esterase [Gammaproteobacteria bacterium]|nr:MAG: acyl-CoA esterase [Gammaproteobacteria bacterium]
MSRTEGLVLSGRFYPPRQEPAAVPLVLLHGLFGAHANLGVLARGLSERHPVLALDLRNHGDSPWAEDMSLPALAADLAATLDARGWPAAALVGHSLGGKAAMQFALDAPQRCLALAVLDIAARSYPPRHQRIFAAIEALASNPPDSRQAADARIAEWIPEPAVRQFLLANLRREADGRLRWRFNAEALRAGYAALSAAPQGDTPYPGPALFLRGSRSDYVRDEDIPALRRLFPQARVETVDAGHWLHADAPQAVLDHLRRFFAALGPA